VPVRGSRTPTAAWATTSAIPCGAIVLLRLREVAAGPLPEGIAVGLAVAGGIAAIAAVAVAFRHVSVPVVAGRAFCVTAAAPVIALTGIAGAGAGTAIAAGICTVMLVTALTPAWERIGRGRSGTALAAFALGAAGSLPIGFGITAFILELSAIVSIGRPGVALLAAVGVAGVLGAAAAVRVAARVLTSGGGARDRPWSILAMLAAVLSFAAALMPGTIATSLLSALDSGGATEPIGFAAIRSNAGDWSGGYIVVAFVIVAAGVWAFATLAGWSLAPSRTHPDASVHDRPPALGLAVARRVRPVAVRAGAWLRQTDDWLLVQPQLVVVLGGAVLGIVLTQFIH
jgi:hypothetical protein